MNPWHWEDLDFHLRNIPPPWSQSQIPATVALLNEVFLHQTGEFPEKDLLASAPRTPQEAQLLGLCLWILTHRCFYRAPGWKEGMGKVQGGVKELAPVVSPGLFLKDPERREEIIRLVMEALEVPITGETPGFSQERRESLDSLARSKILQETRAAQHRAQAIREALARKEAEEAASKYTRE